MGERDRVGEVEAVDDVGRSLMHVDRTVVHCRMGCSRIDGAEHAAGAVLDHLDHPAADAPQVGKVTRALGPGPEPAAWTGSKEAAHHQGIDNLASARAEHRQVVFGERDLRGGGSEVRSEDIRVARVAHRGFHPGAEDRLRVVHEVGVERIVARDQHGECVTARTSGAPGLLEQRRACAGPAAEQHRVESGDIDTELERVGRRDPEQLAAAK